MIRCLFLLLLLPALPRPALATWLADGVPVCTYPPCQEANPVIAPDGAGGVFVVWQDYRNVPVTNYADIYAQHITASGEVAGGWPTSGLPLCTAASSQANPVVVADGQGGFFASWMDSRHNAVSQFDIYAQHLRGDGTLAPGWPVNGLPATQEVDNDQQGTLALDGSGGIFLAWWTANVVWAQHLSASGTAAAGWPSDGVIVCTLPSTGPSLVGDPTGGAIVAWTDWRRGGSIPDGYDVYGVRLTAQGTLAPGWTPNGNLLGPGEWRPVLIPDGLDGFYMASANPSPYAFDANYYLRRFTVDGAPAPGWPAGGVVACGASGDRWGLLATADSLGGVLMDWYDYRPPGEDVYGARVLPTATLAPGWPADGLRVSDPSQPNEFNYGLAPDGSGGAYISWENDTYIGISFIQHLTANGTIAPGWPVYGFQVAATCMQATPQLVPDGAGGAIVVWEDLSPCGNGLFAQRFAAEGPYPVPVLVSLVSASATPEQVVLVWSLAGGAAPGAWIERRTESSPWQRLGSASADGSGELRYQDRTVAAGTRYAYRLAYELNGDAANSAATWVEVPAAARLALAGFQPNPALGGALQVSFSLPSATPATLALLDVSGRTVLSREVGSMGAGRHLLRLGESGRIRAGLYWLRLEQGGRSVTARAAVLR